MKVEWGRLHALVEVDDVQYVEQLPLVLMQPLHLHVKEGVGVEDDAALPGHPGGEGLLIVRLDLPQAGEHARVVPVLLQLFLRLLQTALQSVPLGGQIVIERPEGLQTAGAGGVPAPY